VANKEASSVMPELADLMMLALLIGSFALAFAYAHLCDRVLGSGAG
jgi:hypothetical protein